MERDRRCRKCSINVDSTTELFTVCEGDCAGLYHANCVGLSEEDVCTLSLNIIWMCDICMDKFRRARDGILSDPTSKTTNAKTIEEEVQELKSSVAGILEMMSKATPPATAAFSSGVSLLHSTLISSSKPCNETEINAPHTKSDEKKRTTDDDDDFSLFVTNIDESATERDIQAMVSRAIGTPQPEHIDVVKLTSKWNRFRKPDFISFKVVLDKGWKTRAMDPGIWPKNVRIREFVNRHNETWKPFCQ